MSKRTVLSVLTLVVGGLTTLSGEGMVVGLPLLAVGLYGLAGSVLPVGSGERVIDSWGSTR